MASSHGHLQSEPAKNEQIITEFFAKSLHIILESRSVCASSRNFSGEQAFSSPSSSSSSSSSVRPRDKWFNLALRECPAALENIDFWRQSNYEPMVVDVILVQRPLDWDPMNSLPKRDLVRNVSLKERLPNCWSSDQEEQGCNSRRERIVERWILKYESRKNRDTNLGSKRSSCTSSHTLYKKSILLLRSLYLTVRLLPAYKLFHDLNSSSQIGAFTIAHHVSSFVEPFTRREEAEMQWFGFTPVDTSCGRLCLSVLYQSSLLDVTSEPSTPMSPQFIPDYVGSPLADPLKRFPSLPVAGPQGSPSSPFSRRHSWSYDIYRASLPIFFSPSPTHSESCAAICNPGSGRPPPMSMPPHRPETSASDSKTMLFDEFWPSPVFSPSSSPSPPIHIPGGQLSTPLFRSGSAPVSIPASKLATAPSQLNKYILPPSPPLKGAKFRYTKEDKSNMTVEKLSTFERDEIGKTFNEKMPFNSITQISFSRSSSRLSFQDDFDDPGFACPFDVDDDDDITNPGSRPELFDQKGHSSEPHEPGGLLPIKKSQDAAVGALVRMLKKAPPLRQDVFKSVVPLPASSVLSSGLAAPKTASDALDELRGYKDMTILLRSKVVASNTMTNSGSATEP